MSAGVSQSLYFMPITGKFVQALSASVALQLPHSATAQIQTSLLPSGKTQWLVAGSQYTGINGMQLNSTGERSTYSAGKFSVTGTVRDAAGNRIQGMSIVVGKEEIFTNGEGEFMVREKKSESQTLAVNIADALTPGSWTVVSCPEKIQPGQPIEIIVARDMNALPATSKADPPAAAEIFRAAKPRRGILKRFFRAIRGRE